MWSQYDENLRENPFWKEILDGHNDIIERASLDNWIICVPRIGSFEADLSMDIILDHILVPGPEHSYCTLSKKYVTIKNRHIHTDSSQLYGNHIEILFEETFYIDKIARYIVWCIDRPLFMKYECCTTHSKGMPKGLHDCIDFLWAECSGHGMLDSIRELCNTFIEKHVDIEGEDLQTQKELIGKLFSECLQVSLKSEFVRENGMKDSVLLEKFKVAVEAYMQYCLGRKLVFSVNTLQYQTDAYLNRIIRNSSHLQFENLGISSNFSDIIGSCKNELNKINHYVTVLDKINCLKNTFSIMFENKESICITSDDVLQILVFLILKLKVNNWSSNLVYIKEFQFSLIDTSDQNSYFLASLEAALEFIRSSEFLKIEQKSVLPDVSQSAVIYICDKLKTGEMLSLRNIIVNKNIVDINLCHPLCNCEKCQKIIQNQDDAIMPFNPNRLNDKRQNLLIVATIMHNCEVVEFLLNQGFAVNFSDCFGKTSLHYAASKGYQNILLLLVNHKADVNILDNDKNTPLHLACENGHENCIKALLYSSGVVELNIGNFYGDTPIHLATKWGYFEIIKILLENGASVIIKNKRNQLALNLCPNYYILKLFRRFAVDRSTTITKELTVSYTEKVEDTVHTTHECKEHGIRPKNIEQLKKIELLLRAIESNDLPLTCFHLGFSMNMSKVSETATCHPLCRCERCQKDPESDIDMPKTTRQAVNINMCNFKGYTSLHIAAKFGRTDILRLLLDCGALLNVRTYKTLYTPLHLACLFQRIQIVRELLKCGDCKIDEQDSKGNTPLFYACMKNDVKIVEVLLINGADCNKKNYLGRSPLMESEQNLHYRVFKLLKNSMTSYSKDSNICNSNELF